MEADFQELVTEGYPLEDGKKARLYTRGEKEAGAVIGKDREGIVIQGIHIIGCRKEMGWLEGGAAIIIIGGWNAKDPVLADCVLEDPRGWSGCHLVDGSQGGRVINNRVGPCGQPPPDGPWADGLSIACKDGIIAGNTIVDATDGAIVVFCAPGTLVTGNTIIARTRNLLGGINLVDPFPFECNYTNTRVVNNRIISDGAFVHLGIGVGPTCWGDEHDKQNYGGLVKNNIVGPGRFGYGFAAAGCKDFQITNNQIAEGTHFVGSMDIIPEVSPPTAFLRIDDGFASGTFQADFVEGPVRYLIGVRDGFGRTMKYNSGNLRWCGGVDGQNGAELRDARVEVSQEGRLLVWDQHVQGRVLWSSPPQQKNRREVQPILTLDRVTARLTIKNNASSPQTTADSQAQDILWDPSYYLSEISYQSVSSNPALLLSDRPPYLQVKDGGNTLLTTHAEWASWELRAGHFVAVTPNLQSQGRESPPPIPHDSRPNFISTMLADTHLSGRKSAATPTLPPRPSGPAVSGFKTTPTYLYLDANTSHLVLHTSRLPTQPEKAKIVWESPNWKQAQSQSSDPSKAVLQGDGNFVIYAGQAGAVWATGSNAEGKQAQTLAIVPDGQDSSGARIELRGNGKIVWSSQR